jgi:hypothetical protein
MKMSDIHDKSPTIISAMPDLAQQIKEHLYITNII